MREYLVIYEEPLVIYYKIKKVQGVIDTVNVVLTFLYLAHSRKKQLLLVLYIAAGGCIQDPS
jgi:hypothetical protein